MKILTLVSCITLTLFIGIIIGRFYHQQTIPKSICPQAEDFNDRFTTMTNLLGIPNAPRHFINGEVFDIKEVYANMDYIISKLSILDKNNEQLNKWYFRSHTK